MTPSMTFRMGRVLAVLLVLCGTDARAALAIIGTRFVYPANAVSLPIKVGNTGDYPILLQAWLDKGEMGADPRQLNVPFVLTPPILRLDPQQRAVLQLRYTGEPLPQDRESVFWINLLEVPPQSAGSTHRLRLSYRMRMKVLFRPEGLGGHPAEAARTLSWTFGKEPARVLRVSNPSPYYVSVPRLALGSGTHSINFYGITVEPYGTTRIDLSDAQARVATGTDIHYEVASDNGETISASARIQD